MNLIEVESSMICAVGYDTKEKQLKVHFNSGKRYIYEDVPEETYKNLLESESKGRFMRNEIIGVYPDCPIN